ncbi:MAG: nucleotidyl transferase AbiEii/AbiGii toxin family protein [Chloroflexi bacterium]|nr:nucleotidyl transferase AbiEii/AbiGii toxin family protein [Chloroflexota bacterium]
MIRAMIGFGELRKRALEWQWDIADVERAYATNWLLKGIYDQAPLAQHLLLRGGSALRYGYSADYPLADPPEFLSTRPELVTHAALAQAMQTAQATSGLKFAFNTFERGTAKFEYTGPLGRRSAAQPRITLAFIPGQPRLDPARVPLVHPFGDTCAATVTALALAELVAERMAILGQKPRARDVFDLWFAVARLSDRIAWPRVRALMQEIAEAKHISPPLPNAPFDPGHREFLQLTWDKALHNVPRHPPFSQVEQQVSSLMSHVSGPKSQVTDDPPQDLTPAT